MILEDYKIEGWIIILRKLLRWQWFDDSHMVHIFLYLMLRANRKDGTWRGLKIKTGQLATGIRTISNDTGISFQSVRTCLHRLRLTKEIKIESTHLCSIITINKYLYYQHVPEVVDHDFSTLETHQKSTREPTHKPTHKPTQPKTSEKVVNTDTLKDAKEKSTHIPTRKPAQNSTTNNNNNNIDKLNNKKSTGKRGFRNDKKSDYLDLIIEKFQESYQEFHGAEYEITNRNKERAAAAKFSQLYKNKCPDNDTVTALKDFKEYFSACVGISDRWLRDNMSLPVIVSKYNPINIILRNGKDRSNSKKGGVTNAELGEIISRKFAVEK